MYFFNNKFSKLLWWALLQSEKQILHIKTENITEYNKCFPFLNIVLLLSILFRIVYSIYHPGPSFLVDAPRNTSQIPAHSPMLLFLQMTCIHIRRGIYLHDMLSWAGLQQFRLLNKEESSIYTLPHARGRFISQIILSLSSQGKYPWFLEKERDRDGHLANALEEVAVLVFPLAD